MSHGSEHLSQSLAVLLLGVGLAPVWFIPGSSVIFDLIDRDAKAWSTGQPGWQLLNMRVRSFQKKLKNCCVSLLCFKQIEGLR